MNCFNWDWSKLARVSIRWWWRRWRGWRVVNVLCLNFFLLSRGFYTDKSFMCYISELELHPAHRPISLGSARDHIYLDSCKFLTSQSKNPISLIAKSILVATLFIGRSNRGWQQYFIFVPNAGSAPPGQTAAVKKTVSSKKPNPASHDVTVPVIHVSLILSTFLNF